MIYKLEILDSSLKPITQILNLAPLNSSHEILEYTQELSNYGTARFRVATHDPLFRTFGDILQPYANHVRITRLGAMIWEGMIISCPHRTRNYVEVKAYTYLYLLSKILINHDAADGLGGENFRTFQSGTMAAAITTVLNETKINAGSGPLTNLVIGTIENPNFPANFTDAQNNNIGGQTWAFSTNLPVKFDYRDILYVLQSFGVYAAADMELVTTIDGSGNTILTFNFKKYLGNKQTGLVFEYTPTGAIENYDAPLDGERMVNALTGIAADNNYNIIKLEVPDTSSVTRYGKLQGVAGYNDAKNVNVLRSRIVEELLLTATPDSEINITLGDRAYPLGQYGLGDTVTIKISDHIINVNTARRIVGIRVVVRDNGKESIILTTNVPRESQ